MIREFFKTGVGLIVRVAQIFTAGSRYGGLSGIRSRARGVRHVGYVLDLRCKLVRM